MQVGDRISDTVRKHDGTLSQSRASPTRARPASRLSRRPGPAEPAADVSEPAHASMKSRNVRRRILGASWPAAGPGRWRTAATCGPPPRETRVRPGHPPPEISHPRFETYLLRVTAPSRRRPGPVCTGESCNGSARGHQRPRALLDVAMSYAASRLEPNRFNRARDDVPVRVRPAATPPTRPRFTQRLSFDRSSLTPEKASRTRPFNGASCQGAPGVKGRVVRLLQRDRSWEARCMRG